MYRKGHHFGGFFFAIVFNFSKYLSLGQIVDARRGALEVEVPPARVGFRPVRQVTERNEQVAQVLLADFDERGEGQQLSLEREGQLADTLVRAALAARGWNLQDGFAASHREHRGHTIVGLHGKIRQRRERSTVASEIQIRRGKIPARGVMISF